MEKTTKMEFNLKKVALLVAVAGTAVEPTYNPSTWRYAFKYHATRETDNLLTAYDSNQILNISPKRVMDSYTAILHQVRQLRAGGAAR